MKLGRPALVAGALAVGAAAVAVAARRSARKQSPDGKFLSVDGVELHYLERGEGTPVVLLHGNGVTAEDWVVSGVFDGLATNHRVLAFDRPGFGYSNRPKRVVWTPARQAELVRGALAQLGVERAVVVGQSWGTLVAVALALDFPDLVERLVLVSGYYFPSVRLDVAAASTLTAPVIGGVLRSTVAPLAGRLLAPVVYREIFAPAPVPERFARFPLALSLRPSQMRAQAEDATLMDRAAAAMQARYRELAMPVVIIAGRGDRLVPTAEQSARLADAVPHAIARYIDECGHMAHYCSPELVIAAAT